MSKSMAIAGERGVGSVASHGYHEGLMSRNKMLNGIMSMLQDDNIRIIGIQGPAGAGKTMLAEKAAILAAEQNLFDTVLIVVISGRPETSLTDEKMRNNTHIFLSDCHTQKQRAAYLNDELRNKRKCLLILSDVEEKLDLHDVQISSDCKFVLTSRDEKICVNMGAKVENIIEVGHLSATEAHYLLLDRIGEIVDDRDSTLALEKMLKNRIHLPLSIDILANILRNQGPDVWEHILAQELEMSSEEENAGRSREIYSVVKLSYSYILEEEQKLLFLLCCLSPNGYSSSIPKMLKYGIGLGLFENVTTSMAEAYKWAVELVCSSLFLRLDSGTGEVWIHDAVREAGRVIAKTGKRLSYVEAIYAGHEEKTYSQYTRICMMPGSDYEALMGWDMSRLELLLLSYVNVSKLSDDYFQRMQNIMVLDLSNSSITSLPSSVSLLVNLQTLLLENSCISKIKSICSLTNLQVLSLKNCLHIASLPKKMGNLVKLRLLDLTNCKELRQISLGVFSGLTLLEGLLMKDSISRRELQVTSPGLVGKSYGIPERERLEVPERSMVIPEIQHTKTEFDFTKTQSGVFKEVTSGVELLKSNLELSIKNISQLETLEGMDALSELLKSLPSLRVLEMTIRSKVQLSESHLSFPALDYFDIDIEHYEVGKRSYERKHFNNSSGEGNLVSRDFRVIGGDSKWLTQQDSKSLLRNCENLILSNIKGLKNCFNWEPSQDLFPNLQVVLLSRLDELEVIFLPTRLRVLRVTDCASLEYICPLPCNNIDKFEGIEEEGRLGVKLCSLQVLKLRGSPKLKGFLHERDRDNKPVESHSSFFNEEIAFFLLEALELEGLERFESIWELDTAQEFSMRFPNVQRLSLFGMTGLRHVWSFNRLFNDGSTTLSVQKLKELEISHSPYLSEIVSMNALKKMRFPQLHTMKLDGVSMLDCLCEGAFTLELPALRELEFRSVPEKEIFVKPGSGALSASPGRIRIFHEKISFACLKRLKLSCLPCEELWNLRFSEEFNAALPNLSNLQLNSVKRLRHLWKFQYIHDDERSHQISFGSLQEITISNCDEMESLFSFSVNQTTHPKLQQSKCVSFPELRSLTLSELMSFRSLVPGRSSLIIPSLTDLAIQNLPNVNVLVKVETSTIASFPPEEDDSEVFLRGDVDFPCLERLFISKMPCLEMIIDKKEKDRGFETPIDHPILFPQLVHISLYDIPFLRTFSSTSNPMIFPSLANLNIWGCGSMESFSSSTSPILTPKLNNVLFSGNTFILAKEDLNTIIQRNGGKHKPIENLPRRLRHPRHNQHDLYLYLSKTFKRCDECGEPHGDKHFRYSCSLSSCDFTLHPQCALKERQLIQIEKRLPQDEAWELFKSESQLLSGHLLDSPEVHFYAKTIVDKCQGSALVIKITARALRMLRNLEEWKLASKDFPSSGIAIDHITQQLKFSYHRLKSRELRKVFILSSLFEQGKPINVSRLVNCMIDEGSSSEEKLVDVQTWGHDMVMSLIDAALLESVQDGTAVRMHHLVRYMALDIIMFETDIIKDFAGHYLDLSQAAIKRYQLLGKPSSRAVLAEVAAQLKEPPSVEKWEQAKIIFLMDNEFGNLPEKPKCSDLFALYLHRNSQLRIIQDDFFTNMPGIRILNLSKTRINSLPQSLTNLKCLEVLVLRDCERLFFLPEYVGKLSSLCVLDLQGTELSHLPESIHKLKNLKKLMVSFYGTTDISESEKLPKIMSKKIMSISGLREVGLYVRPGDIRWSSCAADIVNKRLITLKLDALSLHFPQKDLFERFIRKNKSWKSGQLKKFNFIVGPDAERAASEIPNDMQVMYNRQEQCLKFVSGQDVPTSVIEVLKKTRAFYVDHHVTISDVCEFGVGNMSNVKLCIIRDCPVLSIVIPSASTLSNLKLLSLNSCPKVKFVFTWCAIEILPNLEQLIVEDCLSLECIVAKKNDDGTSPAATALIPLRRLRVLRLHILPELRDICDDQPLPCLEYISISYCRNLKNLQLILTSGDSIKQIKVEKAWWDSLEWDDGHDYAKVKVVYLDDAHYGSTDGESMMLTLKHGEEEKTHKDLWKGKGVALESDEDYQSAYASSSYQTRPI